MSANHLEPQWQAATATILGNAQRQVQRFDDAVAAHERAIDLYRQLDDQQGEGSAWTNLGLTLENVGRLEDALIAQQRAGGLFLRAGDRRGEGLSWNNHGVVLQKLGRFEHAIRAHQRAYELFQELEDQREEGAAWDNLGLALRQVRRSEDAAASTYQGGNGAAPNDRSIRIVPLSANNSQGGLTSAYYDYYRILAADPFFVQAILADGSTAW